MDGLPPVIRFDGRIAVSDLVFGHERAGVLVLHQLCRVPRAGAVLPPSLVLMDGSLSAIRFDGRIAVIQSFWLTHCR